MPMKLPTTGGGEDFVTLSAGVHPAICVQFIDLGTQMKQYKPTEEPKPQHMVKYVFEVYGDERRNDGKRFVLSTNDLLASMSKTANLRKMMESWRGQPYTDQEAADFDAMAPVGRPVILLVEQYTVKTGKNAGKLRARIKGYSKPKKADVDAMNADGDPETPMVCVHLDQNDFDVEQFNLLDEWTKDIVKKSPEYQQIVSGGAEPPPDDDYDDNEYEAGTEPDPEPEPAPPPPRAAPRPTAKPATQSTKPVARPAQAPARANNPAAQTATVQRNAAAARTNMAKIIDDEVPF